MTMNDVILSEIKLNKGWKIKKGKLSKQTKIKISYKNNLSK